ncbi:hypothetical protein [Mesorhizobium sp.]|uniref:hypothetical protein n=1 Tax=Mesorhizobium sp. TaxID=1871066 RepID=UPI000FE6EEE5|nr:hypothetical protein [Mesorhizobium sp.]RWK43154.1 MAG: hypothetical protein EOR46_07060 [Mesorhizobium sp.]RWK71345.1 MAG: hypothetical protein EOR54_00235 [Mesorhizobium sp.]RWK77738.1 MAG: hypothetical protein EOR50_11135 [Mesorhizobium sp.]RWK83495.1 MAG: hypothetical protein EOR51_07580 [Mesorhizobium sp.]RWL07150.1 MAG: hypothetical protein EOR55_07880 [Mesorhizobium sp.]
MKMLGTILAAWVAIVGGISATAADPWKDESGHGKWQGRYRYYEDDYEPKRERYSYKEEYRRGNCKIERKWFTIIIRPNHRLPALELHGHQSVTANGIS